MMKLSEIYKAAFEKRCCQLLIDAYNESLIEKNVQFDWNENDVSQEIYEKIDCNPKRLKWDISASREFHLTSSTLKIKGFADKLPRIDLRMSSISNKFEYKYFCEAKRLKEKDSSLKRAFINDGMDRFISEKYPLGCMLGYLLQGNLKKTISGINTLLIKDKRSLETLNCIPFYSFDAHYESNHVGLGKIKHFIFDFTVTSN